ncbi:nuclear transport factor 2 family protein [Rhizosphaericola mali]|uniref:SnoaL-like domain-containing protein n=1 Tax=Rhizosphaericola mali TaxID=2545455 RepID=A0A5P2G0Z6_9BACT|nr:nuclear transport factor 2 family protein [Rhizosphaericola mali]QES88338.1 hypothetical protein E0W69_006575 [Rhizosphaericola mali]
MEILDRNTIKDFVDNFLLAWQMEDSSALRSFWDADAVFNSSAHGSATCDLPIVKLLLEKQPVGNAMSLFSSNLYFATKTENIYTLTFYVYGIVKDDRNEVMTIGATVLADIEFGPNTIKFKSLTFSLNWIEGEDDLIPNWRKPLGYRFWKVGDPLSVIVSEVDAPWNKYSNFHSTNIEEELLQTYARYAWAIDQADFHLLQSVFTHDIEGDFTPMGYLKGNQQVIGTMKAFRQSWPWMQHFGEPISYHISEDGNEAELVIGRIIPQQYETVLQSPILYGANYELKMRKEDSVWKISYFSYHPGWFYAKEKK